MKSLLKYGHDFQVVMVAILYFGAAVLGHFLVFEDVILLPSWPPSGVALALVLILGRRVWPGITIGALLASLMAYWNNPEFNTQTIIFLSIAIAGIYTLEAVIGNFLIKKFIPGGEIFDKTSRTFSFLAIALLTAMVGASGALILYFQEVITGAMLFQFSLTWWIGNWVGILLFTPFLLTLSKKASFRLSKQQWIEIGLVLLVLSGMIALVQVDLLWITMERALPYLLLPFLLWMAFRLHLLAAITSVLVVSLSAIYFTIHGLGPFALEDPYHSMLLLQIFIGVISLSTIVVSATVAERKAVQKELETFNLTLEKKVKERTKELEKEIQIRSKAEMKLQKTNAQLRKTNTELDNFVYSVSHDLRAPIASMLGLTHLAKNDPDTSMKDTYIDMIRDSATQQDEFIKEILDQSKNSRLSIKKEPVIFEPLIEETFKQLRFATQNEKFDKKVKIDQEEPFITDPWRMKVIFNNLISNAIRYRNGREPQVEVIVGVNKKSAHIKIKDNGRGIASEHLDNVYKMFYRATDDNHGSGLGLYIVKEMVDKLKGKIHIESEENKGTTVNLEIPISK